MSAPLTLGSSERAELCPQSFHLDQVRDVDGTEPMILGLEGHAFLQRVLLVGRDEALLETEDLDARARCALIRVERLPAMHPDGYRAEVGVALNVATGEARILGDNMTHDQVVAAVKALGPDWIGGVIDVLGITPDQTTAIVLDYKTGWKRVAPAARNRQLQGYAVAACRALKCTRAVVGIVYVRADDRDPWFDVATISELQLDELFDDLAMIHAEVAAAEERVRRWRAGEASLDWKTGEHCRRCPALAACGAHVGILMRSRSSPPTLGVLTDADAERALRDADDLERALKAVKTSLHNFATARPVKLANGLVYGPVVGSTTTIDGEKARAYFAEQMTTIPDRDGVQRMARMYLDDDIAKAMTWKATQASIEKLVAPHAPPRGKTKMIEKVTEELRARGAVSTKITTSVKVHNPGEER